MYQFYYADHSNKMKRPYYSLNMEDVFNVEAVRPTMWEEHCLECSAPACFGSCPHYEPRRDGRCKRFENGIRVYPSALGIAGQGARVRFRQWANMMTIIYPAMISLDEIKGLTDRNQKIGRFLRRLNNSPFPMPLRWNGIRTIEYMRRRYLRKTERGLNKPDAFVFHGYSFEKNRFQLILEIYQEEKSVFKTSFALEPGENLIIIDKENLSEACSERDNLVKIYPENNIEAEIDILWCDFVQGRRLQPAKPADKVKCLVWDLDNTLWEGILIETEDPGQLKLNPQAADLIKELDHRGILQSIASKNDYDQAWPVLERTGLAEYFLYPQIHWNAKSESMKQIAEDLNIGIDTLALIDDSVFERNQVWSECNSVRVYDVSELAELLSYPEFDVPVTEVSKRRRRMYQDEEKRMKMRKSDKSDPISFLRKCNISAECFSPQTEEEIRRCFELTSRTNQLNLSGIKYTEEEFSQILQRPVHRNVGVSCQDDFGSYGIVAYMQYTVEKSQMVFCEYAMSCRVAGKYLESALFKYLLEKENCSSGTFHVIKTEKNKLLRRTLEDIGFTATEETDTDIQYIFEGNLKETDIVHIIEKSRE